MVLWINTIQALRALCLGNGLRLGQRARSLFLRLLALIAFILALLLIIIITIIIRVRIHVWVNIPFPQQRHSSIDC